MKAIFLHQQCLRKLFCVYVVCSVQHSGYLVGKQIVWNLINYNSANWRLLNIFQSKMYLFQNFISSYRIIVFAQDNGYYIVSIRDYWLACAQALSDPYCQSTCLSFCMSAKSGDARSPTSGRPIFTKLGM